ncbi:hypothetical protein ACFL6R_03255 [Gemmatimonadota bacterium]
MPVGREMAVKIRNCSSCRVRTFILIFPAVLLLLISPLKAQTVPDSQQKKYVGLSIGSLPVTQTYTSLERLFTYSLQVVIPGSGIGSFAIIADYCPWDPPESRGGQTGGIGIPPELKVSSLSLSLGGFAPILRTPASFLEAGFFLGVTNQRERLVYTYDHYVRGDRSPRDIAANTRWLVTADIGCRVRLPLEGGPVFALEFSRLGILTRWNPENEPGRLKYQPGFRWRLTLLYPIPRRR